MAGEHHSESWDLKYREDEELEFFTELALHETERWIQAVTRKPFAHPDDPRKSLQDGKLLCELLNCLRPGTVKRINQLATPIAGLDNVNVFLAACRNHFGLVETQLFDSSDLEDLSHRAIADSAHIKQEAERRLRNVAITVYWLARASCNFHKGPYLDYTAFSALVSHHAHSKDLISDQPLRRGSSCSLESNELSSAYGSHEGNSKSSLKDSFENRHTRDSSYDSYASYEKGSEDSLDDPVFEIHNSMPGVRQYGSSSTLNRNGASGGESSGSQEALYTQGKSEGMYRSSPDLCRGSYHQRTSSADSLDGAGSTGSYYGSHSRQSSDSAENYPTRSLSTSGRKPSVSTDPLQFVKTGGAAHLARQAAEQIRLAEIFKKEKKELVEEKVEAKVVPEEEGDWQSNLSSWKNRRKSRSERIFSLKDEMESQLREDAKERPTSSVKTFSQMKEERERRKSGYNMYPLDDDEDVFKAISTSTVFKTPMTRRAQAENPPVEEKKEPKAKTSDVAPWAADSEEESQASSEGEEDSNNNQLSSKEGLTPSSTTPSSLSSPSEHSDGPEGPKGVGDPPGPRTRRVGQVNRLADHVGGVGNDSRASVGTAPSNSQSVSRRTSRDVEGVVGRSARAAPAPSDVSEGGGGRVQGKITDIRKQFERRQDAPPTRPGAPVDGVDVRSRTKSFERGVEEAPPPPRPARTSLGLNRAGDRKDESNHSFSSFSSSSSTTTYPSSRLSGRDCVEKGIKISQKPNNERGFGFTLSGGAEKRQPFVVEKVSLDVGSSKTRSGAADVCELKVKDELISVNRKDVAKMTHPEVTQLISESVRTGQLELRVKRYLDSSKDEDEDFLSSDDELTETMEKHRQNEVQMTRSFDSLDSKDMAEDTVDQELAQERCWMRDEQDASGSAPGRTEEPSKPVPVRPHGPVAHYLEQKEPEVREDVITPTSATEPQQSPARLAPQTENKPVFEVETRSSITLRKASVEAPKSRENDTGPIRPEPQRQRTDSQEQQNADFGPPSILLKWQRQRPKSDLGQGKEDSSLLSSSLSWRPESASAGEDEGRDGSHGRNSGQRLDGGQELDSSLMRAKQDMEETMHAAPTPAQRHTFAFDTSKDHKRMRDWDRQQAQMRQTDSSGNEVDDARDQEQFEQAQHQMQQQYQAEQHRASEAERQRKEQDQHLLEPEMERTRLLEERRAERRARLQRQQQEEDQPVYANTANAASVAPTGHPGQADQIFTVQTPQGFHPGSLIIDPRNRSDSKEEMPAFQLNIRKTETSEGLLVRATPPTQMQQSPHGGFSQSDAEKLRWEDEEKRRQLEEKEARIRQEEERLRLEREQLRLEQERLQREKEMMERQKKAVDYADHNGEMTSMTFEPVASRVRASTSHSARLSGPPVQRYGQSPVSQTQYSTTVVIDPKVSQTHTVSHPAADWSQGGQAEDRNQDFRPGNISLGPGGNRERLTREDILAMNRKSTPLQARPELSSPTDASPTSPGPIVREAPNKQQLRSLNVVPKPRFRAANEWITSPREEENMEGSREASRRHSEVVRRPFAAGPGSFGGGGEHWLIEEAERRRMAESTDRKPYASTMGPIKPAPDRVGNRWSDPSRRQSVPAMMAGPGVPVQQPSMPAQIRQTLLQRTAGVRTSTGSNYSQELNAAPPSAYSLSPSRGAPALHPRDYGYDGQPGYREQQGPLPPAGRAPPPPGDQALPVSGKQKCSHCCIELGFGAAMVIESLGLYYHVQCFRCCVCHAPLGSGVEGTDVRVRVNKLHCPNCYSNDEGSANIGTF